MRFSEQLASCAEAYWQEAAQKPFLTEMAQGTLDRKQFQNYMLQDYLYLRDYIDILRSIPVLTEDPSLIHFIEHVIIETEQETDLVHVPSMKHFGITDDQIAYAVRLPVITDYVAYMKDCLDRYGLEAGLTALLQCSWSYARVSRIVSDGYKEEISRSPYRFWFEAYTGTEYLDSNQGWIDVIDRVTATISKDKQDRLCHIFTRCASFENALWDAFVYSNR